MFLRLPAKICPLIIRNELKVSNNCLLLLIPCVEGVKRGGEMKKSGVRGEGKRNACVTDSRVTDFY